MSSGQETNTGGKSIPDNQVQLIRSIDEVFSDTLTRVADLSWEYGLQYSVDKANAIEVFTTLRDDTRFLFNMLVDVTAIDWLDSREQRFEVVYHLLSITYNTRVCIRIAVDEREPKVESVLPLWKAANFLEREVWDMFGIEFENHGDLRRIMMYEEFVGHPLRKDYPVNGKQPRIELRIPELHNTAKDMNRQGLVSLPVRQRIPHPDEAK